MEVDQSRSAVFPGDDDVGGVDVLVYDSVPMHARENPRHAERELDKLDPSKRRIGRCVGQRQPGRVLQHDGVRAVPVEQMRHTIHSGKPGQDRTLVAQSRRRVRPAGLLTDHGARASRQQDPDHPRQLTLVQHVVSGHRPALRFSSPCDSPRRDGSCIHLPSPAFILDPILEVLWAASWKVRT